MSAPLSERTKAILQALQRHPGSATVSDVVESLRFTHPYAEWRSLTSTQQTATVRRYLGRLVDEGRVIRLKDGVFSPTWDRDPEDEGPGNRKSRRATVGSVLNPGRDTSPETTDHDPEGDTMTDTMDAAPSSLDETDKKPLRALLDVMPRHVGRDRVTTRSDVVDG